MKTLAEKARDEAMARVDGAADVHYKQRLIDATELLFDKLGTGGEFTTDAISTIMDKHFPEAHTHEPRAIGPFMSRLKKFGIAEKTGQFVRSENETCHARDKAVWRFL